MKTLLRCLLNCNIRIDASTYSKYLLTLFLGFGLLIGNIANAQLPQFDNFESGYGNWNDGGNDCARSNNNLINGNFNIRLRDNTGGSDMFSDPINLSTYNSVTIEFFYRTFNFSSGEDFFVEYNDGTGGGYIVIANYANNSEFINGSINLATITINTSTYNLTNNARFRIRCDASTNNDVLFIDNINIYETPPQPINDDCSNATVLLPTQSCIFTLGTTTGATQSQAGCVGIADDDVWYSFVATSTEHEILVDPITMNDAVIQVFDAPCVGSSIECHDDTANANNELLNLNTLTIGNTYYIRVYSYFGGSSQSGDFNICLTEPCTPSTANGTSALACPSVDVGELGLGGSDPAPINCSVGDTTTALRANYLELGDTSDYTVEAITYAPPYQFSCLENPVSISVDDVWSPTIDLDFDFCFYDNTYSSMVIGSNGVISFDTSLANSPSGYRSFENLPTLENTVNRYYGPSIYGVHHDVDPSVGGEIGYQSITLDTGCKALVAAWSDVPMFGSNSLLYTGMIVFYEDTNVIEVYVKEKRVLSGWNDGNASIGLQKDDTEAITAPNRNTRSPNWEVFNEAWRFVPSGPSITELKWYENSISPANEIIDPDDDGDIVVQPISTTTYHAEVTYTLCSGETIVETDATTVTVTGSKIWNGSISSDWDTPNNWTPAGAPVITNCITIPVTPNNPVMSSTSAGLGYNLEIFDGASLTQESNALLTIEDAIYIQPNGDLEIRDNASIVQITDVVTNQNTGNAKLLREGTNIEALDYAYWSSPVGAFNVEHISPGSSATTIFTWTPTVANGTTGNHGTWNNTLGNMTLARGYAVRGLFGGTAPKIAEFEGILNNGQISFPISRGSYMGADYQGIGGTATAEDDNWNLIGNPYPSAISLADFIAGNPDIDGTLYFWRHLTPTSDGIDDPFYENYAYNYDPDDYLSANALGPTPPGFNGYIASGQGFFAFMLDSAPATSTVNFSNTMRGPYANDGFFRNANDDNSIERHRIWLDLVDEDTNTANSILVGYAEGATNSLDRLFDGHLLNQTNQQFYSIESDSELAINGKALPFDDTDSIPLGFKIPATGSFAISINSLDGLFEDSNQGIYLEDTELNIIHDLRLSPYLFSANEGTFNDRFILRFNSDNLGLNENEALANLQIRAFNNSIIATSQLSAIKIFEVFDIAGRSIYKNQTINKTTFKYVNTTLSNGAYLVKISLDNGLVTTKKIVL